MTYGICNFCGSTSNTFRFHLRDWITKKPGEYNLVECNNCGLLYLFPKPSWEELKIFYPDEYPSYNMETNKSLVRYYVKNAAWRRRYKAILNRKKSGKILDVGCASGNFLAKMSQNPSWECYGVEPISYAAQLARQFPKLTIYEGMLQDVQFPDSYFDVVTVWDVIEHTDDPAKILREIWRILKIDGLLVIRVPDPNSFLAQLFGPYWVGFDAPRHLFTFPRSVLIKYLKRTGFTKIELGRLGGDHFPFFASLGAWLTANGKIRLGKIAEFISISVLLRIFLAPIFLTFGKFGISSSVVYFAWKQDKSR